MGKKTAKHQTTFQLASLGAFGHNIISAGESSNAGREYFSIQALEDSIVSYNNTLTDPNHGDVSVSNLLLKSGTSIVVGSVDTINVTAGKVIAYLINTPDA